MSKETTITEKQFEGLRLVPPIDLHINYKHNLSTAIQAIYEFLRKTKDKKHKATYINDEFQRNVKVISAYEYLCNYLGIAFRCSAEGIIALLKKLTNKEIQETLKQKNVENIAKIVELYKELIELIIKAKEAKENNNPTIEEIKENPNLISTLNINTLTNEEGKNLVCRFFECFSHKETFQIMDNFNLEDTKKIDPEVFDYLSKESPEGAMNFLKNKTKEIFINLSNNSNFINNCIEGGFVEGIREIMDTLSFEEIAKINVDVWNIFSKANTEEAMKFLKNSRDKAQVFIYLSHNSNFIENCIKGGFGEAIREIMDNLSLKELRVIHKNVWNIFSKANTKEAMNFLDNRNKQGDLKEVFRYLSWESNFPKNCIEHGSRKATLEIIDNIILEKIEYINPNLFHYLSTESLKKAMKILKDRRDMGKVFIDLCQNEDFIDFIKIGLKNGLEKEIYAIMGTFSLKELKRIDASVWNTLSKKSPEEVMKFLNNRGEDKEALFLYLFKETNLINNCIDYGSEKEIRDIIFELKLQNNESFKNVMKKLK